MNPGRFLAFLGCLSALSARVGADERNDWPVRVAQVDDAGRPVSWEGAGPLIFKKITTDGGAVSGLRPLWVRTEDARGLTTQTTVLYPLFIYRADSERYHWTLLQLINRSGPQREGPESPSDPVATAEIWPFWFSHQTGDPATSYQALFPLGGTLKRRFTLDELSWVAWPLYLRAEKRGAVTTSTPWPFVQVTRGTTHGVALWPLVGWSDQPERFHRSFFLWPLGWDHTIQPAADAPAGTPPTRQFGFLPFYTRDQRSGSLDENYAWPFFGRTDRTLSDRYQETRYLWPLLVQGRGDQVSVNRWGPFYTHSVRRGVDKTWVLWPLVRRATWTESGVAQTQTQFFYVLYWSLEQRSVTNPRAAPAHLTHLWPWLSHWDNGAGRRQIQFLSPFEALFTRNEQVREAWTPLFALYRFEQRAPDDQQWSALWRAVTWRREGPRTAFHLGPLLGVESGPGRRRVSLVHGLLGWRREPGDRAGHVFWFDFSPAPRTLSSSR